MRRLVAAGALAAAAAVALAGAQAQPDHRRPACFNVRQIQASRLASPRTLYIRLGGGVFYEMDFASDCDVTDTTLVLRPVDNSGEVCSPVSVNVGARGGGGLCLPTRLHRLSAQEVAVTPRGTLP